MNASMIVKLIIAALMIGSVYAALGITYSLIYKASGLMNLAQGNFLMLGAYIGLTFYNVLGQNIVLSFILTFIFMFFFGVFVERGMITTLLQKGAAGTYIILCTAALALAMENGAILIWTPHTLHFPQIFKQTTLTFGYVQVAPENLLILFIAVVASIALFAFLNKTKFGTAMRAAAMDERAASELGINVQLTKGVTWGLSSGLAGILGMALGPVYGVYSTMGAMIAQKAFAGSVTGGYGNIYGAVIGGLLFGFLETAVSAFVTTTYKDVISFAVLIIILVISPTGIFKEKVIE